MSGGPFLWTRHARTRVLATPSAGPGTLRWQAEHHGYARRRDPVVHRRTVDLDAGMRQLTVLDEVTGTGPHPCRSAFHLGPAVDVELDGVVARLGWDTDAGRRTATLHLPDVLQFVGSGTVGPEAISIGLSPGTSEMSSVTTLAGWHAAASRRPPLSATAGSIRVPLR